jgi:serine protease Do
LNRRDLGLGLLAVSAAGCAQQPGPAVAQRGAAFLPDFADLAERVLPAVVNIAVTSEQSGEMPQELRGTPYERLFRNRRRPEVAGAGSGFIVDPAGFVVSNNHVVGNTTRVVVALQDGTELPARIIATDEATDLALLKVESRTPLPAVPWGNSAAMRVGNWVLAAGNPFRLGGTVTVGIVSARGREIGVGPFDDFIQTDAAVNPGNSGGPLFNVAGEVIGINTAIYSPTGAYAGISFATPSDIARPVIDALMHGGRVDRGWLGVSVRDQATETGSAPGRGVLVAGVERGSPAARAGLRNGDTVTAINGERVDTSRTLVRAVAAVQPGQTVRVTLLREGRPQDISVQVGRRPAQANPTRLQD